MSKVSKPNPFLPTSEPRPSRPQRNGIDPQAFIATCVEMVDSEKFGQMNDFLTSVAETVERSGYVTQNQAQAVRNIADRRKWEVEF